MYHTQSTHNAPFHANSARDVLHAMSYGVCYFELLAYMVGTRGVT